MVLISGAREGNVRGVAVGDVFPGGDPMKMEQQTDLARPNAPATQTGTALQRLSPETKERALRDVAWVAEFLGVSKSWVYQATANGVLPCIRLGSALRFEKATIERWIRESRASP